MHLINQMRKRPHVAFSMLCVVTVASGYVYTYTSSTVGVRLSIVFLCLSVATWGYFCVRRLVRMTRIRFSMKKYASSYEMPDHENMQRLAGRMGVKLDKKHPFVIKLGLDNAYSDPLLMRVVVGDVLLNRLESQEHVALVSHELTHLKKNHLVRHIIPLFVLYLPLVFTLRREQDWIFCAVWIALFMMLLPYISRRFEYEADAGAVRETSPEISISLLKKTEAEERWRCETVTHPSTQSRIDRIEELLRRHQCLPPTNA